MTHKILKALSILTAIILIIDATITLTWMFYPDNVVMVKNPNHIQTDSLLYHPGDRITYTFSYCKTRNISAKVDRALVDGYRLVFESENSNLPDGCHTIKNNELVLPHFTQPGIYMIEITATYPINPLRNYIVELRTVPFEVK